MSDMINNNPISKLLVLELASVLAGPAVGMFFAELGAKVIKIENPQNLDVTRSWKLPQEDPNSTISGYFSSVNYHKQYLKLDLSDKNQLKKFYRLVKQADILVGNFRNAKHLDVDYETLIHINPRLIYANITGYAQNSTRGAYDAVLQAESGLMSINGTTETGPIKLPLAFIDIMAAHQLKQAILLALFKRTYTNKGAYISISLYEAAVSSLANQATNWLMSDHIPQPIGSLHPNIAPYGEIIKCKDGEYIILAIGNDKQFNKLCAVLGISEIANDTRFSNNAKRVQARQSLNQILSERLKTKSAMQWHNLFIKADVPAGKVLNIKEVFENDIAKKMVLNEQIDGLETKRVKTIAFNTDFLSD